MRKVLFLISISLLTISCQKNLSDKEAMEIVSNNYFYHCGEEVSIYSIIKQVEIWSGSRQSSYDNLNIFKDLEKKGFINIKERKSNSSIIYTYELTNESKSKYLYNNKIAFVQSEVKGVLGISQEKDKATVLCKVKIAKTPFYDLQKRMANGLVCRESEFKKEFKLIKYDKGWKLSK
ncbi:MAG: hypothetical protein L3J08_09600 [Flavobacteriaceae bacterium]|nr:hypothetical protein [Flavobacteriaceae bacterium]